MAEAYRRDGQPMPDELVTERFGRNLIRPDYTTMSERQELFKNKFGPYIEAKTGEKLPDGPITLGSAEGIDVPFSRTPTRDMAADKYARQIGGENYSAEDYRKAGNMFGGEGRGFYGMGYVDIPFVGGLFDAKDASVRLQETKETDDFSLANDRAMEQLPFTVRLAALLTPQDNVIKQYYDGKKEDLADMLLGFGETAIVAKSLKYTVKSIPAGAMDFLSKFARKAEDALPASFESMIKSAMPKMPNDFASIAQADAISGLKRTDGNPYDVLRPPNVNTAGALASLTKTPRPPQVMTPDAQRTRELIYGEFDRMTAAENAKMMEMQKPFGDYDVTQ
jgi:hypothetical protein